EIVFDTVAGGGLHDHPGAVVGDHLAEMPGRTDRIAHVVEAVEHRDEVVGSAGDGVRTGRFEGDVAYRVRPRPGGALPGDLDRRRVNVAALERRPWERLGHQPRRRAVTAAYVGDRGAGGELVEHPVECGQPLGEQMCVIGGPEEPFAPDVHVRIVVAPADTAAGAGGLEDRGGVADG